MYSPLMQSPPTSPSSTLTATIHSPYANQPACASNLQYCGDQVRTQDTHKYNLLHYSCHVIHDGNDTDSVMTPSFIHYHVEHKQYTCHINSG